MKKIAFAIAALIAASLTSGCVPTDPYLEWAGTVPEGQPFGANYVGLTKIAPEFQVDVDAWCVTPNGIERTTFDKALVRQDAMCWPTEERALEEQAKQN